MPNVYLVRVFASIRHGGSWKSACLGGVQQIARLGLAFLLALAVFGLTADWESNLAERALFMFEAALLLAGGFTMLLVELLGVVARSAFGLPWRDAPTTALAIAARAFVGVFLLLGLATADNAVGVTFEIGLAVLLFGWNVPGALRSLRDATVALRALPRGVAVSPRMLLARGAPLGRHLVVGQVRGDALTIERDGIIARVAAGDRAHVIDLERAGATMALVADASADGEGYRSAGVQLAAAGLPIFALDGHDAAQRLRAYGRRLRIARFCDLSVAGGALLVSAGVIGIALSLVH
jgi:uncharacterized membrane protein YphA (DoxX/SURF4 family)